MINCKEKYDEIIEFRTINDYIKDKSKFLCCKRKFKISTLIYNYARNSTD